MENDESITTYKKQITTVLELLHELEHLREQHEIQEEIIAKQRNSLRAISELIQNSGDEIDIYKLKKKMVGLI